MITWFRFKKIEGNDCNDCGCTGINQWFDCDGQTIYSWQKPNLKPCETCQYDKYLLWKKHQSVRVNGTTMLRVRGV